MKTPLSTRWQQVRDNWLGFLSILLEPAVFFVLAISVGLGLMIVHQDDERLIAIFTVLLGLATGLLGGLADRRLAELTEGKLIYQRGQQAVRGLKLLLGGLSGLSRRVGEYIELHTLDAGTQPVSPDVTLTCFQEVIDRCLDMQERTLSAIEDWTDIVPEASIRTQIGEITRQTQRIRDLEDQLAVAGKSDEELQTLKSDLEARQRQLARTLYDWLAENPHLLRFHPRSELLTDQYFRSVYDAIDDDDTSAS